MPFGAEFLVSSLAAAWLGTWVAAKVSETIDRLDPLVGHVNRRMLVQSQSTLVFAHFSPKVAAVESNVMRSDGKIAASDVNSATWSA